MELFPRGWTLAEASLRTGARASAFSYLVYRNAAAEFATPMHDFPAAAVAVTHRSALFAAAHIQNRSIEHELRLNR
jgi:hypothetical protein